MANKRIEKIKSKISYLERGINKNFDKLNKKFKRKKNVKPSNNNGTERTNDNRKINFILNPIENYYTSIVKYIIQPNLIAGILSFIGGYLFFSFSYLFGLSIVLFTFFFVPLINCFENRFLVFLNDTTESKNFQEFIINDTKNQLDLDQIWLTKNELIILQSSLPWYLSEAEIESATWLNSIIETVWLQIHAQFNDWLDSTFGEDRTLNSFIGQCNIMLNLKITQSSLGNKSPCISGIRVIKQGVRKEDAILECEIIFDSNLTFQIEGNYALKFGLNGFYFRSKVRIVAGPLFREMPAVGSISVNLIEKPIIDWKFTGCLQVLNIKLIKNFISYFLNCWLGQPSKSKLNIAKFLPLGAIKLQNPIELIKVDLIEATNIPRGQNKICCKSKKANTYCLVVVDNDEKSTNIIQNSDNPEYNQTLMFFVYEEKTQTSIKIYVYNEQPDEDELIGFIEISAHYFKSDMSEFNGREFEIQLLDPETKHPLKSGETKLIFRITWLRLTSELTRIQKNLELCKGNLPVATLSVLVNSASGMDTVTHQIQTPELRILVRIRVGNQVQVTSIKERTGYPVWEEVVNFMLFNPKLEDVFVEIVDMYWVLERRFSILGTNTYELDDNLVALSNNGLVLGYTTIRTTEIMSNYQMRKQGTFQLEGYSEEAFIRLLLTIRLTEISANINTNHSLPRMLFPNSESSFTPKNQESPDNEFLKSKNDLFKINK